MAGEQLIVDTSIILRHFRAAKKDQTALYKLIGSHELFISAVTEYELYVGAETKDSFDYLDEMLADFEVIPFDFDVAHVSADMFKTLKRKNRLIGVADIFIAATAFSRDMQLATTNEKHFDRVDGLRIFDVSVI